ncbi:ABC transporter ATP-binding protein [Pseudonocardia sp. KRD291]|uniref:ABC transporter ATP-binding protein n=1 Tax=Pseudonocardia sp. KRD291 TaxID=2792007 RepID=UPI001C4A5067|nr:ABC transporter ATP-binding protein [Pseudonocardia sp. KRD291]MBW0105943.1 ABC transporter ATP-binding protein [Pseudonocardia sp. KRD291]
MIRLEQLTKRYPGQDRPAVDRLDLDVPPGEIVVLLGPSGCGKTTTMKLINRLIEPTSGTILLDGEDVTRADPDALRRRIGYAIQQTGLFPHRSVADNVATVPRMLGWDRKRVAGRVDELLTLVGLDPDTYRGRLPRQLSGGQQQRVGVARALGADPEVMLMDEPFGAIDPLTRETLQNEFLRIQSELGKTIVFVTHDIDEAVKMGDRIAIFNAGSGIEQYDTPERILTEPATPFVSEFVGSGAAIKRLTLSRVGDVPVPDWPSIGQDTHRDERAAAVRAGAREFLPLLDADRRPLGWVPADASGDVLDRGLPIVTRIGPGDSLFAALDAMLAANSSAVVVVDDAGAYRGVLDLETILSTVHTDAGPAVPRPGTVATPGTV